MPSTQKYGDQSRWIDGLPDPGVNKIDTGSNSIFWLDGEPYPVLYTQNKEGVFRIKGKTSISTTPAVNYTGSFTIAGQCSVKVLLEFGGSATDPGSLKYWLDGNSFDLIKQLVGSPSKIVGASLQSKPKNDGYPTSIKMIDARMSQKRTSATGGGSSSNVKVGDQSRWIDGLPIDGLLKENNS